MKTVFHTFIIVAISLLSHAMSAQDSPFGDHYWIIVSSTISPALDINLDGKPDTDLRIIMSSCEKDNAESYQNDGLIILNRGMTLCEEEEERVEEVGTWTYDEKTKKLTTKHYGSCFVKCNSCNGH